MRIPPTYLWVAMMEFIASSSTEQSVQDKAEKKLSKVIDGLYACHKYQYNREEKYVPVAWNEGSSSLLEYNCHPERSVAKSKDLHRNAPEILLFVPSLINRSYIFDLSKKHSMIEFLSDRGIKCLLLDWGEPSDDENNFGLREYIARLEEAISFAFKKFNKPVTLVGYCMGGLIAMASKLNNVNGLALLAVPWNFHSLNVHSLNVHSLNVHSSNVNVPNKYLDLFSSFLDDNNVISGEIIYNLMYFFGTNPFLTPDKYEKFMTLNDQEKELFVQREEWLHDNVPLTSKVVRECFIDWAVKNVTMKGEWLVDPSKIDIPVFAAIPEYDKIVPKFSAKPLVDLIPNITTSYPLTGHIGMIAGKNAEKHLWLPLEKWTHNL